jgi:hypothetical protein
MAGPCGATAGVGEWNDFLPGSITFVGWSSAGSTTSKTSSAWCASVACKSCSGIYETSSTLHRWAVLRALVQHLEGATISQKVMLITLTSEDNLYSLNYVPHS